MDQRHDLIVFSHLRWRFVWQRPQHLISRLGRGRRTWFLEEPASCSVEEPTMRVVDEGAVTRVVFELPGNGGVFPFTHDAAQSYVSLLEDLVREAHAPPIVWLYTPMALRLARLCEPALLVYDVMDDLASFKHAPSELRRLQDEAMREADLVFAGGRTLYTKAAVINPERTFLFPSGVEPRHYENARRSPAVRQTPVAGYVGVIDERVDLRLVGELASQLPDWEIRMVGPIAKIDPATLPHAPNIAYHGVVPYGKLPHVMAGFDVALMPFALNEATRAISPTKTLEYLAAGLPVVSTPIVDVVADYANVVVIANDPRAFAQACRDALCGDADVRHARAKPLIHLHNWDAIADRMADLLADQLRVKRAAAAGSTPLLPRALPVAERASSRSAPPRTLREGGAHRREARPGRR